MKSSYFKEDLWKNSGGLGRNSSVTPIFLERYRGPRTCDKYTRHDFWEFTAVVSGKGILYADEQYEMQPETIFLMPPGLRHRESSRKDLDTIWLGFRGDLNGLGRRKVLMQISAHALEKFLDLWSFSVRNYGGIGCELDGMTLTIIGYFLRMLQEGKNKSETPMRTALKFINEHFHEDISFSELSEKLDYSQGHFYRQFREFTGTSPLDYLNRIRIQKAVFLLKNTDYTIRQTASLCGFKDPYYFSRAFKKLTGASPKQYRDKL